HLGDEVAAEAVRLVEQLGAVRRAERDLGEADALRAKGRAEALDERAFCRERRGRSPDHLVVEALRERAEDLLLVLELEVERGARDARFGGDVLHRGPAEAVAREADQG